MFRKKCRTIIFIIPCFLFTLVLFQLNYISYNGDSERFMSFIEGQQDEELVLIKLLAKINAFIIDVDILSEINEGTQIRKLNKFAKFKTLSFGIFENSTDFYTIRDFIIKSGLACYVNPVKGFQQKTSLLHISNIYISCQSITLHLAIFFDNGEYFWAPSDEFLIGKPSWFGDYPRAINRFELKKLPKSYETDLLVPDDLPQFIYDYKRSKNIRCKNEFLTRVEKSKSLMVTKKLRIITNFIEKIHKNYWISFKFLSDWYFDCTFSKSVTDADIAIKVTEYDEKILDEFLNHSEMHVQFVFGSLNEGYQIRFSYERITIDLFLLYEHQKTQLWNGYYSKMDLYRIIHSDVNEFCSAIIDDHKFVIPCQPEIYFGWSRFQMKIEKVKTFSKDEFKNVIKYYHANGTVDKEMIDTHIQENNNS